MASFLHQNDTSLTLPERMTKDLLQGPALEAITKQCSTNSPNFLTAWLSILTIPSAEKLSSTSCRATFRFPVQSEYLNPMGTLHAGATSAMFECATTWTLYSIANAEKGFWGTLGVCRTIAFTYLRPVGLGEWVVMECETVHVGKRVALVKGVLRREKDGAVLVTCEHNKFNNSEVKI